MAIATITTASGLQLPFDMWEGQLLDLQPVADFFQRIGQVGRGAQITATQAPACDIVANTLTSSTAVALDFQADIAALTGSRVRVADTFGTVTTCLVLSATARIYGGRFTLGTVREQTLRIESRLTLEVQE